MPFTRYCWRPQPQIDIALFRTFMNFLGYGKTVVDMGAGYWPGLWNTYFPWGGSFRFRILRHLSDFDLRKNYAEAIAHGMRVGMESSRRFLHKYGIDPAQFRSTDAQSNQQ